MHYKNQKLKTNIYNIEKTTENDFKIYHKIIEYAENMVSPNTTALTFFGGSIEELNNFIKKVSKILFESNKDHCSYADYSVLSEVKSTQRMLKFNKIHSKRAEQSANPEDRTLDTNNISCLNKQIDKSEKMLNQKTMEAIIQAKIDRQERRLRKMSDSDLEKIREDFEYIQLLNYH